MKITVYTTTDCQYSKQEKDYLVANKLVYEEKNLETNKEFLTEMLAISNNFAGTPVTRVEKDDGSIVVLKGFTKGEFDTAFGFAETSTAVVPSATPPSTAPVAEKTPIVEATPAVEPVPTPVITPEESTSAKPDELNSVLDKLEEKTEPASPSEVSPPVAALSEVPSTDAPPVPDFPDASKTTA